MLSRFALSALLYLTTITPAAVESSPPMTRITYQYRSPKFVEGSFSAKPRTLVRAGTGYGRMEEAPDPEHHIHGLIVVAEPDLWMINLANKQGQHGVDPGPTFNFHAQVLASRGLLPDGRTPPELRELEFGQEVEFFKAHQAKKEGNNQTLELGDLKVQLTVDPKSQKPTRIQVFQADKTLLEVLYLSFETGLPFDQNLFRPPPGIEIVEARRK